MILHRFLAATLLIVGGALLAGCQQESTTTSTGSAPAPAKAEAKVPEKLVIAFQKQKDPTKIQAGAERIGALLSAKIGIPVEVVVPASYSASVQALVSNKVQVAYVSALPFIMARAEAPVELLLAEVRDNRTEYDSVFVVRKDDPAQTLADLRGRRMMFTSPTSTSGYVMAYSRLVNEGLLQKREDPAKFFSEVGFAGGYDRALMAVFNGQSDVCAVSYYTVEGPKADLYSTAEMRAGLRVLARTPGVPTHLLCMRSDLPADFKEQLRTAFLAISAENPEVLADVYGAARFEAVDSDAHVAKGVEALENTGLLLKSLVD
jgi:phosphonate transport system substrate-binding protein